MICVIGHLSDPTARFSDSLYPSKDWEQALRLIHHHRDDIGLIMGWDSYSFSALVEGAVGVMAGAANVVPDEIVGVARAIRAGDIEGARAQWRRVFPVIDAMLAVPFTQAVKAGLHLRGVPIGSPREPLLDLSPDGVSRLEKALAQLNN
jgi:4-hydroxy-tetrahydrodipicolinate synthase